MMRIKSKLVLLLTLLTVVFVGVSVTSATAGSKPVAVSKKFVSKATFKARAAATCGTSNTYLHVACATEISFSWVEYDCCRVLGRNGYKRFNDQRVDIDVQAYRNGTSQCRWVIVRGTDVSKYAYYHPDKNWRACAL